MKNLDNLTADLNEVNNDILNQKEKNKMIAEILNKD
jgi:hypothetical protein